MTSSACIKTQISHDEAEPDEAGRRERDEDSESEWEAHELNIHEEAVASDSEIVLRVREDISEDEVKDAQLPDGGANIPLEIEPLAGEG